MMSFNTWLNKLYEERGLMKWLAFLFELLAGIALFALMVFTCADVIGRYFLQSPILGAKELTEIGLAIVVFAALPVITWRGGQIVVDLIDHILPEKVLKLLMVISSFIVATSLYFVAFRIYELGLRNLKRGIVTDFLHIQTGYVMQFIAVFSWITALTILLLMVINIFRKFSGKRQENQK